MREAERVLKDVDRESIIVIEDFTTVGYCIGLIAERRDLKLIGIVHNVESLVPEFRSKFTFRTTGKWLLEEIESFKRCCICLTISREENWLLRIYGINSYYWPYNPTKVKDSKDTTEGLNKIPQKYLILGSASNPPTIMGMIELANILQDCEGSFYFAGFDTERLHGKIPETENIVIAGTLTDEELKYHLATSTYAIVHQVPTSGVLTRIKDLLNSGLIVLANPSAARSYHDEENVIEYRDLEMLKKHLDREDLKLDESLIDLIDEVVS